MNDEIIVYHHLGLGDHFICNGLVNKLSEDSFIHLICKENNYDTVASLYSENDQVKVVNIKSEDSDVFEYAENQDLEILKIGFCDFDNETFDESFYTQLGYNLVLRYNNFKLPRLSDWLYERLVSTKDYCLISDTCSEGQFELSINTSLEKIYIKPGITTNLLDYVSLIKNAKEIHCIDSAVYHLVDSIGVQAKLFFHDVRNSPNNKIRVSNKWIRVQ